MRARIQPHFYNEHEHEHDCIIFVNVLFLLIAHEMREKRELRSRVSRHTIGVARAARKRIVRIATKRTCDVATHDSAEV